jgi:hypothetical protein
VAGDLFTEHAHPLKNVKSGRIKTANTELKTAGQKYGAVNVGCKT